MKLIRKDGTQINNHTKGHKDFKWFGNLPTSIAEGNSIIIEEWEIQILSLFSLLCISVFLVLYM